MSVLACTRGLTLACRYGLLILGCECVGASAVVLYGLTIVRCMPPEYVAQHTQPAAAGEGYDVQVSLQDFRA